MYEVELRALVDNFEIIKKKLDESSKRYKNGEKEVTIFFYNPCENHFDLRLRLQKGKTFLSFKESLFKTARKEIESDISDAKAIYEILISSGFKIKMIVARIKYSYIFDKFDILLNRVLNWGDAVEVECTLENETYAEKTQQEIKYFMTSFLGLNKLLAKEEMLKMNEEYINKFNFYKMCIEDLLNYVNDLNEIEFFPNS